MSSISYFTPVEALTLGLGVHLWRNANPQRFMVGRIGLIFFLLRRFAIIAQGFPQVLKNRRWKWSFVALQRIAELGSVDFILMGLSRFYPNVLALTETWSSKNPQTGKFTYPLYLFWSPYYFIEQQMFKRLIRGILKSPKPFLEKYNLVDNTDGRNVFVGMWPGFFNNQLPDDIHLVLDLSNDWEEADSVFQGRDYFCCPVWDQTTPVDKERFARCVEMAAAYPGNVYIHCGFGVGRSVQAATAILIKRGIVSSWQEGLKKIKASRPIAELKPEAQAFLEELTPRLKRSPLE